MKKVLLSAFIAASVLVACAPKASPAKTNELIPTTASTATAEIAAGHTIFNNQCTKCHTAKTNYVTNHTYAEARPVLASMSEKAKLSSEEAAQVAAYVNSVAKK